MITCEIDKKQFKNGGVMARHLKSVYGITTQEYYHKYIVKNDITPTCKCGCGDKMKWKSPMGYTDYSKGHLARIKNNWGHNQKAIDASSKTRKEQYRNGERTVWNKGLSKETDDRVRNNANLCSISFTEERKEEYAHRMRSNRLDGTVPTLDGENHPNWKGGISPINCMARADRRLYTEWKYPILKRDQFQCVKCKSTEELQVHHNVETVSEIVRKIVPSDLSENISFEEKTSWSDKIVSYHIDNNVSGETLCIKCHCELHPSLNFK